MTTPADQPIEFTRGDSWDLLARVKGRNGVGDLVYLDLTGCTPKAQIRANVNAVGILAEITCTLTNQTTMTGGVLCRLEDTDTSALTPGVAVWDLEIKWPGVNGDRKTILSGVVTISADITHA